MLKLVLFGGGNCPKVVWFCFAGLFSINTCSSVSVTFACTSSCLSVLCLKLTKDDLLTSSCILSE